jgi:hypothetical protein
VLSAEAEDPDPHLLPQHRVGQRISSPDFVKAGRRQGGGTLGLLTTNPPRGGGGLARLRALAPGTRDSAHAIRFAGVGLGYAVGGTGSTTGSSTDSPRCGLRKSSSFSSSVIEESTAFSGEAGVCVTTVSVGLP